MVTVIRQEDATRSQVIDATPTARGTFLALIRAGYTLPDAVAEYVDNAIEQARLGSASKATKKIDVRHGTQGQDFIIEVEDNCGGCPRNEAVRFVRPGMSGIDPEKGNISRFGIGGKAAGLAVSSKVEIMSRAIDENGWKIILDRDEILNKDDWKFKVSDLDNSEKLPNGATKIRLHIQNSDEFSKFPNFGKKLLEERYGMKELSRIVDIFLNGQKINLSDPEYEMLNGIEAPEHCQPHEYTETIRVPITMDKERKITEVSVKVKLGFLPEGSRVNKFGMNIYCNGRLLVNNSKLGIYDIIYEEEKMGHAGSQLIWLRGVVYLNGSSEAMPWNSRKSDLDSESPTYRKLEDILKTKVEDFLNDVAKAKAELKTRNGSRKVPDTRDIIVDHYVRMLKNDPNFESKCRKIVTNSKPFADAKGLISEVKKPKTDGDEIPNPPPHEGMTQLAAHVETEKVEAARKKIEEKYGKTSVRNTEIVRIVLEHFISCGNV